MSKQPSRREILSAASVGIAAAAIPGIASARTRQETTVTAMEKEFAKPLSDEAKKLLAESLKGIETARKDRLKTKLPENTEPCFTYIPSTREVRAR
ncbi:MAG: hypothetical protein P4L46_03630 [Fimbriimonas sp.]|nr:hypothetical protein [Fimbriimonas sp.]